MNDLVIRGGTVVDGSGQPAWSGDIVVNNGKITQAGGKASPGKREIQADGCIVTPGWIDVHTHYDGQATWDSQLAPSSWHGVTTAVMGNCGVGFAPVRAADRETLIRLMEGVEDIPGAALHEGMAFDWKKVGSLRLAATKERLAGFVAQGQLGIFTNGYWGHPAMKLSPEVNLLACAHYLQDRVLAAAVLGGVAPAAGPDAVAGGVTDKDFQLAETIEKRNAK